MFHRQRLGRVGRLAGLAASVALFAATAVSAHFAETWRRPVAKGYGEALAVGPAGQSYAATQVKLFGASTLTAIAPSGERVWQKRVRGGWVRAAAMSADGARVIVGGVDGLEAFVASHDAETGRQQWARSFSPDGLGQSLRIEMSVSRSDGTIYLAGTTVHEGRVGGYFVSRLAPDGTILWTRSYGGTDFDKERLFLGAIAADPKGKGFYLVAADQALKSTTDEFSFLVRYDNDGDEQWKSFFGEGSENASTPSMAVSGNGKKIYLFGSIRGDHFFVRLFTARGKAKWSRSLRVEGGPDQVGQIAVSTSGKTLHMTGSIGTAVAVRGIAMRTNTRGKKLSVILDGDGGPELHTHLAQISPTPEGDYVVLRSVLDNDNGRERVELIRYEPDGVSRESDAGVR